MKRFVISVVFGLAVACSLRAEDWPCWRGPRGDGTSSEKNVPIQWNAADGKSENIAWKVATPGYGHSSPIVLGERIFLTACIEAENRRVLLCYDRATGKPLWQRDVVAAPLEFKHGLNSFASSTPTADAEHVYVTFLEPDDSGKGKSDATPGHMVVAAFDHEGNQKWLVRPGRFSSRHGYCSCPVLYKDLVIVNGDHDGDAYIVALRRGTGETVWKIDRENNTRSYVTPIVRETDGRVQMILSGNKCVASYDPATGKQHWIVDGPTEQFVASMVYDGKLVFLTAGFPEHHILAIRPDGSGNVTDTHIVWRTTKACSYVPSPIVVGEYFLCVSDEGMGTCYEAATGKRHWLQRMGSHYSGSLVTANGLVYFTDDSGVTKVVRPGKKYELVAENKLGERTFASPAISSGAIFLRTEGHLVCIKE
jgi:outer membrane protein assembly factor BamB